MGNIICSTRTLDLHIKIKLFFLCIGTEEIPGLPKGIAMRRNIREVMDETKLDESTLAAQRQELERLQRVQEQQRLLRELQRQAAQERMQHKVISMLQGNHMSKPVSIAPVSKKMYPPFAQHHSDSDSEGEDRKPMLSPPPRPKSKPPVPPTIDISSDDDCIVVSEPEGDDEEPEDDPGNSGMHTNDEFNQPDEQGRCYSQRFGCILAHSMGLGKTLQIVTFSDIFLRHTPAKTILCIMPINTLQNWMAEFNMWVPVADAAANSPLNAHGEVRPRNFNLHVLNDSHKTLVARARVIHEWRTKGGVLLIGYEQFRLLSLRKFPKSRKKIPIEQMHDDDRNKMLFDEVHAALVKPGPDLVICDEGHRIKNSHASISQALKQMDTKRRVVLTGYPLQNNLMEYWCMVDFVRPNYLGSKTEFCNMFERPIMNGQCIDSTEADIKLMRYRAHVLHSLLLGFVQRRSHAVLQTALPQKEEYVLLVRMKPFQRKLYETFMNAVVRTQAVPNPLKAFAVCCKIWNHPDVLYNFLKKRAGGEAVDIDLEEVAGAMPKATNEKPKKNSSKTSKKPRIQLVRIKGTKTIIRTTNSKIIGPSNNSRTPGKFNQNDYFGPPDHPFNPNANNSNANHSWIKKEDIKPAISNMLISPKSETSNDSKPKINIISDIKLPPVFSSSSTERKINIISDIKIEPKIEELDDFTIKHELVKNEVKSEYKMEDEIKMPAESSLAKLMPLMPLRESKEDSGIPYDWKILPKWKFSSALSRESIALGDRLLVFSQSLITLDLIEQFLQMNLVPEDTVNWMKNVSYYRLDGSTSALEREKLINEFNSNPKIHLFLVSTRAGSLGINLIGANRVVVLDASWNPCHDTQAVCRVYRYGQRKPCFVYRLVVDNCLEKKIYDRQINKQGMSDRVVDECNPDAHLTLKDVSTLCWDDKRDEGRRKRLVILRNPSNMNPCWWIAKKSSCHSKRNGWLKKDTNVRNRASRQPAYNMMGGARGHRPVASVRPMQQGERPSRWIPAEHWQRQGMTAQEMTLPLDVVIPTNQPEKAISALKAGQKVLVLKSPKGVYMQLESGKIVAIKTAIKVKGKAEDNHDPMKMTKPPLLPPSIKANPRFLLIRSIQKRLQANKSPKSYNIGSEIAKSLNKDSDHGPMSSSDDEHNNERPETADEIQKRISMLKKNISIQRVTSQPKQPLQQGQPPSTKQKGSGIESSALEQLEQTTSSVLHENIDNTPFQDTLDSITSAYHTANEDNMESFEDDISETSTDQKQQEQSEASDQSDEVTYVSDQSPTGSTQFNSQNAPPQSGQTGDQTKGESQEFNNYKIIIIIITPLLIMPLQHLKDTAIHLSIPPPYDMMGYPPQPQPPQYNYGYQGYPPPPQPHYPPPPPPQPGYDYNAPPPAQPIYGGYHNPYPPTVPPTTT
ncbi:hypothetical protein NQ317_006857, partial [Molorchus minor]